METARRISLKKKMYSEALVNWEWPQQMEAKVKLSDGWRAVVINQGETEGRIRQMQACLVARIIGNIPNIHFLEYWGKRLWQVSWEVWVKCMPNSLFLFFPSSQEVGRVLKEGRKELGNCILLMDAWVPRAGCLGYSSTPNGAG